MKTRSARFKESPSERWIANKGSIEVTNPYDKYVAVFLLVAGIVASIVTFFTMRPDLFWVCTLILVFGSITLLTRNASLASLVIGALPLYAGLVVVTIPTEIMLAGTRTVGSVLASIFFHFINFTIIIVVTVREWKRSRPALIILASIFYMFYIPAFIIAVKPEHGLADPYHALFLQQATLIIVLNIVASTIIALIIRRQRNSAWW